MEAPTTQREVEEEEVLVDVQIQEQEEGKTPEMKATATDPWDVLADHMRAVKAALVDIRELNRFEMSEEEADARAETWMTIKELVEVEADVKIPERVERMKREKEERRRRWARAYPTHEWVLVKGEPDDIDPPAKRAKTEGKVKNEDRMLMMLAGQDFFKYVVEFLEAESLACLEMTCRDMMPVSPIMKASRFLLTDNKMRSRLLPQHSFSRHLRFLTLRRWRGVAAEGKGRVSAGETHSMVLAAGGSVVCFGRGEDGPLGNGSEENEPLPFSVPLPVAGMVIKQVCAGDQHSMALSSEGLFSCCKLMQVTCCCGRYSDM